MKEAARTSGDVSKTFSHGIDVRIKVDTSTPDIKLTSKAQMRTATGDTFFTGLK